jgi:hypothetical protein
MSIRMTLGRNRASERARETARGRMEADQKSGLGSTRIYGVSQLFFSVFL